ncbi:hypothetical protein MUN77_14760 [Leucobacter allii]|uniref:ketopantoate reductase family protein n=1 Tax=Leucobacter allii TaxID=2932247 RepID=UPI001FD4B336|nr:2-dehydropantoate 2-reductase N-terminal domain-containing protein [Leucobacter allii]UOR01372.1 hypothetical protein MUN77_14760 [Leucobacter allii]
MTAPRIAVFGAGANGGAIAASLARTGADVVAIDPWPQHIEAIRANGLTVVEPDGAERTTELVAKHLCQLAEPGPRFDLIVLGVKSYDTRWACELLQPVLAEDGALIAVQNGITLDVVADVLGVDRSVGAVIEVAANLATPGRIVQEAPMWLALGGESPLARERAARAAEALSPAATVTVVDDIRSAKWMKLVANACELVPSAILDLPLAEAIAQPGMYDFMLAAGTEALNAGLASGLEIVPIFGGELDPEALHRDRYVEHLLGIVLESYTFPTTLTTVLQDWRKGRRAEIADLNGRVVETAGDGVPAPLNRRVRDLALAIERGERSAGIENLPVLLAAGGTGAPSEHSL